MPLRRIWAALAVLGLVVFVASAARVTLPGLREQTRATGAQVLVRGRMELRATDDMERNGALTDQAKAKSGAEIVARPPLPRILLTYPRPRVFDGVQTRHRWATLAGHGRNGPGGLI